MNSSNQDHLPLGEKKTKPTNLVNRRLGIDLEENISNISSLKTETNENKNKKENLTYSDETDIFSSDTIQDEEKIYEKIIWSPELTKKYRNILSLRPLAKIKDTYMSDTEERQFYRHYDPLAISILMIDIIITYMRPNDGITKNELFRKITPFFKQIDNQRDIIEKNEELYQKIFDKLYEQLTLETRKTRYEQTYTDYSTSPPKQRVHSSRLIKHIPLEEKVILHATDETINIFLQLLDINIEDQQMANNLILTRQIQRGEFSSALNTAQTSLQLTNKYAIDIDRIIRKTRRDIRSIDWNKEIPKILSKARGHIGEVIKDIRKQRSLLNQATQSEQDIFEDQAIFKLIKSIEQNLDLLLPLQSKIIEAYDVYLNEQIVQLFKLPHQQKFQIKADLFETMIGCSIKQLKSHSQPILENFCGLHIPRIMSYDRIISKLQTYLRMGSKSQTTPLSPTIKDDLPKLSFSVFPEDIKKDAKRFLVEYVEQHSESTLQHVLQEALDQEKSILFINYIRILCQIYLIHSPNSSKNRPSVKVSHNTHSSFIIEPSKLTELPFYGQNLKLFKKNDDNAINREKDDESKSINKQMNETHSENRMTEKKEQKH